MNIKDYNDNSTNIDVNIEIIFNRGTLQKYDENSDVFIKKLKLKSSINLSNMNLFDNNEKLKHYPNIKEIIDDYYVTRLEFYNKRRTFMIKQLENECLILQNKWNYIQEVLNDTIDLRKKKINEINEMLENKNYMKMEKSFNYLIKMSMDSVSEESIKQLKDKYDEKQKELEYLKNTTIEKMWLNDLDELKEMIKF